MRSLNPAQMREGPQETGCCPISTGSPVACRACPTPTPGGLSSLPGKSLQTPSTELPPKLSAHSQGTPRATRGHRHRFKRTKHTHAHMQQRPWNRVRVEAKVGRAPMGATLLPHIRAAEGSTWAMSGPAKSEAPEHRSA